MDISKFTKKSQEALSEAQNKAISFGHTEVDGEHLLLALAEQPEGLIPRILARMGADASALAAKVEAELGRRVRVTGPGVEPGKIMISSRLSRLLVKAGEKASRLKDEYISVEHLFFLFFRRGQNHCSRAHTH